MIRAGGATSVYERHGKFGSLRAWGRIGSGFGPSCMAEVGFASGPMGATICGEVRLRFWPQNFLGTYTLRCLTVIHTT